MSDKVLMVVAVGLLIFAVLVDESLNNGKKK